MDRKLLHSSRFQGGSFFGILPFVILTQHEELMKLRRAWMSFIFILPSFAVVIMLLSLLLVSLPEKTIALFLSEESSFRGYLIASLVESVTLISGFVAFPMVKILLENRAGIIQVALFISILMMVGW